MITPSTISPSWCAKNAINRKRLMENKIRIDFNKPCMTGRELGYIAEAVRNAHISGDGPFTRQCQAMLQKELGVARILLTTSCTHALEMAALLLNIQPGDEVIVPAFTFVSTVNAFALRGARPVFSDVLPETFNLDHNRLESLITPMTRAIIPVHYAGIACEMDAIMEIARRHNITVVEDNAHGLFARYRGRLLGTFGALAAQSFHETKNITCGEGGALLINDPHLVEQAEIIREKGTNRNRFLRGQVDKYTWVDIGSSYVPSDILAAYLYAQLEGWREIQERRRQVWEFYFRELREWAFQHGVQTPHVPAHCEQSFHMFYLVLPSLEQRTAFIDHLRSEGILSVFHYQPLHLSDMGLKWGGKPGDCPVTERAADCLVRLPFHIGLTESDQQKVVQTIKSFQFV